jgi:hypothetical protein
MKKAFLLLAAIVVLAGCEQPADNNAASDTTLLINNLSDYSLLSVEYSGVEFGDINSGKEIEKKVTEGTKYIFFYLQTANGRIRCRTEAFTTENDTKNTETITNNTVVTTAVSERRNSLRNIMQTLNAEPANPEIEVSYKNYPVLSGTTVDLGGVQIGASNVINLVITNKGEHDLGLTGNVPQISGDNAAQVIPGNYTEQRMEYEAISSFAVTFIPTIGGVNQFTVKIINNDQDEGEYTIKFTASVKYTWQKLYGASGQRYGTFRAISNQEGGLYAGGHTSNTTAAIFNFDQYGNLKNQFTFAGEEGTVGPHDMGSAYNEFYSVLKGSDYGYSIIKATNPGLSPSSVPTNMNLNNEALLMYPAGIIKDGYYYVAGLALYYPGTGSNYKPGIFVNRHYTDGTWEKGGVFAVPVTTGIDAESFECGGIAELGNGDILLYGDAEKSGRDVAFLCAVNISAANSGSWTVRWSKTYEVSNKGTYFRNCFYDDTNLILLGYTGTEGYAVKIPLSVTAAPTAAAVTFGGSDILLCAGNVMKDGSGYIFVGITDRAGTHGGNDVLVMKTNKAMTQTIWSFNYGGTGNEYADAFIEVNDGFVISGSTSSPSIAGINRTGTQDIYLLKINKDGTLD